VNGGGARSAAARAGGDAAPVGLRRARPFPPHRARTEAHGAIGRGSLRAR
jgi:hypothetical protein